MNNTDEEEALSELLRRSRDGMHIQDLSAHSTPLAIRTSLLEAVESVALFQNLAEEADAPLFTLEKLSFQDVETAFRGVQSETEAPIKVCTLAYQFFYDKLHLLIQAEVSEYVSEEVCQSVTRLCRALKLYLGPISENNCILQDLLMQQSNYLPLLLLQVLIEEGIIDFTMYIGKLYKRGQLLLFKSQLLNILGRSNAHSENSQSIINCVSFFLATLACICYNQDNVVNRSNVQQYASVKNALRSSVFKEIIAADAESLFGWDKRQCTLCCIIGSTSTVHQEIKYGVFLEYLHLMLDGQQLNMEELCGYFSTHSKFCFKDVSVEGRNMLQFIFTTLELETILRSIKDLVGNEKFSLERLLKFIAVAVAAFSDSPRDFVCFLDSLFSQAVAELNEIKFMVSMLLIRHCILCDRSLFPAYDEWLKRLLKDDACTNRPYLTLYCRVLTRIVPHEKLEFLRHQIVTFPQVPRALQSMADDCLSLLKSRLSELRVDPKHASILRKSQSISPQTNQEVEAATRHFVENGTVPKTLIEMSVFKKVYFENTFLPALLVPSADAKDPRRTFAEKLKEAGKISKQTWMLYVSSCKKLAFLEVIQKGRSEAFSFLLNQVRELGDLPHPPNEKKPFNRYYLNLKTYISSLEDHLDEFLRHVSHSDDHLGMIGELADEVLNQMCRYVKRSGAVGDINSTMNLEWLTCLLSMISKFDVVWNSLNRRLQHLARTQFADLEVYHVYTMAAICFCAESMKFTHVEYPPMLLSNLVVCKSVYEGDYQLFLLVFVGIYLFLATSSGKEILLATEETKEAFDDFSFVLPIIVIRLFLFCYQRLQFICKLSETDPTIIHYKYLERLVKVKELTESILSQPRISDIISSCQLSLKDWAKFEIRTSLNSDVISPKKKLFYLKKNLNFLYQKETVTDNHVCKDILDVLIQERIEFKTGLVCGVDENRQNGKCGSEHEIVNLWRYLSETLAFEDYLKNEANANSKNWLLESLSNCLTKVDAESGLIYSETVIAMLDICCLLPASELLRGCSSSDNIKSSLSLFSNIVNLTSLLLQRKQLALPLEITEYFMKAVIWCGGTNSVIQKALQSFLLSNCSILLASFLAHDDCYIWPIIADASTISPFIQFITRVRDAVRGQCWDVLLKFTNRSTFALILAITFPSQMILDKAFLDTHEHIASSILEAYVILWCNDFLHRDTEFTSNHASITAASALIERAPSCMRALAVETFDYNTHTGLGMARHSLIQETTTQLYPVSLLRILRNLKQDTVKQLTEGKETKQTIFTVIQGARYVIRRNTFDLVIPPILDVIEHVECLINVVMLR